MEKKSDVGTFGTGNPKLTMKFRSLIEEIEKGNDSLYLTTQVTFYAANSLLSLQYEDESTTSTSLEEKALRDLCPPPLTHLMGDFPLKYDTKFNNLEGQNYLEIWSLNKLIFG